MSKKVKSFCSNFTNLVIVQHFKDGKNVTIMHFYPNFIYFSINFAFWQIKLKTRFLNLLFYLDLIVLREEINILRIAPQSLCNVL